MAADVYPLLAVTLAYVLIRLLMNAVATVSSLKKYQKNFQFNLSFYLFNFPSTNDTKRIVFNLLTGLRCI